MRHCKAQILNGLRGKVIERMLLPISMAETPSCMVANDSVGDIRWILQCLEIPSIRRMTYFFASGAGKGEGQGCCWRWKFSRGTVGEVIVDGLLVTCRHTQKGLRLPFGTERLDGNGAKFRFMPTAVFATPRAPTFPNADGHPAH